LSLVSGSHNKENIKAKIFRAEKAKNVGPIPKLLEEIGKNIPTRAFDIHNIKVLILTANPRIFSGKISESRSHVIGEMEPF